MLHEISRTLKDKSQKRAASNDSQTAVPGFRWAPGHCSTSLGQGTSAPTPSCIAKCDRRSAETVLPMSEARHNMILRFAHGPSSARLYSSAPVFERFCSMQPPRYELWIGQHCWNLEAYQSSSA